MLWFGVWKKNMELNTISHSKLQGARTLPVSTNHSQGPNFWPREKCIKRLSSLFAPLTGIQIHLSLCQVLYKTEFFAKKKKGIKLQLHYKILVFSQCWGILLTEERVKYDSI